MWEGESCPPSASGEALRSEFCLDLWNFLYRVVQCKRRSRWPVSWIEAVCVCFDWPGEHIQFKN